MFDPFNGGKVQVFISFNIVKCTDIRCIANFTYAVSFQQKCHRLPRICRSIPPNWSQFFSPVIHGKWFGGTEDKGFHAV